MSDFTKMEEELSNGPCVAIEVRGEQAVQVRNPLNHFRFFEVLRESKTESGRI